MVHHFLKYLHLDISVPSLFQTRLYLIISIVLATTYAALNWYLGNVSAQLVMIAGDLCVITLLIASFWIRQEQEQTLRHIMVIAWTFVIGALPFCLGGLSSYGSSWVITLPILALLLHDKSHKPALVLVVFCCALTFVLGYLTVYHPTLNFNGFPFSYQSPTFQLINFFYFLSLIPTVAFFVLVFADAQRKATQKIELQKTIIEDLNKNVRAIVDNIPQGIFMINAQGLIEEGSSQFLNEIFERTDIPGQDAVDLVFKDCHLGNDHLGQIRTIVGMVGEQDISFELNRSALPFEIVRQFPGSRRKILQCDWHPIIDINGIISKIMVSIRDVTELRTFQDEAQHHRDELEIFAILQKTPTVLLHNFIHDMNHLNQVFKELLDGVLPGASNGVDTQKLFRYLHTQKGLCRSLGFKKVADYIHQFEECIYHLRDHRVSLAEFKTLYEQHATQVQTSLDQLWTNHQSLFARNGQTEEKLSSLLDRMHNILQSKASPTNLISSLQTLWEEADSTSIVDLIQNASTGLAQLAIKQSKNAPQLVISGDKPSLSSRNRATLQACLLHILTNSVDHGIETIEERKSKGKPSQGQVSIHVHVDGPLIRMTIGDDGKGLNLKQIQKKALELGFVKKDNISDETIAEAIFAPSLSTAEKLTESSGRGVGLDVVRQSLLEIGGCIRIEFTSPAQGSFRNFQYCLELPSNFIGDRKTA